MSEVHVLLVAAGSSSRMGQSKPLLKWGKGNLLENRIQTLKQLSTPITVVLGSEGDEIRTKTNLSGIQVVDNADWNAGMGNSIAFGVSAILNSHPDCKGILIALVDQPLISSNHFMRLIQTFERDKRKIIVSRERDGHWSVPVLFDRKYFMELIELSGDRGAMRIVRKYPDNIKLIQCRDSLRDMDTPEEYQELLKSFSH